MRETKVMVRRMDEGRYSGHVSGERLAMLERVTPLRSKSTWRC